MRLDYALVAEAAGQDARGALTLIAIDNGITTTEKLPLVVNRVVVVKATEEADELAGSTITVRFSVMSPSGALVTANSAVGTIGARQFADIPASVNVQMGLSFAATEFGRYVITVNMTTSTGQELATEIPVSVAKPV